MKNLFNLFFRSGKEDVTNVSWEQLEALADRRWHKDHGVEIFGHYLDDDILCFRTIMPKGSAFLPHCHSDAMEKIYITKGQISVNGLRFFGVGDRETFHKGYVHAIKAMEDTDLIVIFYRR